MIIFIAILLVLLILLGTALTVDPKYWKRENFDDYVRSLRWIGALISISAILIISYIWATEDDLRYYKNVVNHLEEVEVKVDTVLVPAFSLDGKEIKKSK